MNVTLKAAACSNKGLVRQNNEDNFCLNGHFMQREEMDRGGLFKCSVYPSTLFAVCDGMGGEEAGEEASLLSVRLCSEALNAQVKLDDIATMRKFMHDGCESVFQQAQEHHNHSGATMALIYAAPDALHIANMGDSRIYHLGKEGMRQISEDHTEMQRLLRLGQITPEQIKVHPHRHMILQYWGMPLEVADFQPHLATLPYSVGDRFLLCSDGLTDMLSDAEIEPILSSANSPGTICANLVSAALKNGGRDNITVLVFEVRERGSSGASKSPLQGEQETLRKLRRKEKMLSLLFGFLCAGDLVAATLLVSRFIR